VDIGLVTTRSQSLEKGLYLKGLVTVLVIFLSSSVLAGGWDPLGDIGKGIGNVAGKLLGPTFGGMSKDVAGPFQNAAFKVIGELERLADKESDKANKIVEERLNQLQGIIDDTDQRVQSRLEDVDAIIDDALADINQLENDLFDDIEKAFDEIYNIIDYGECAAIGTLEEADDFIDNTFKKVQNNVNIFQRIREALFGKKKTESIWVRPSDKYRQTKDALLATIEPTSNVEDILYVYSDLEHFAYRMYCQHRKGDGARIYLEDFLDFGHRIRIWETQISY
jgi:hypothetical protein